MSNPRLHRYWFEVPGHLGIGVTAFTLTEALQLARETAKGLGWGEPGAVVQDVDIQGLDQNHVVPNMGPPNFRGVWYPA